MRTFTLSELTAMVERRTDLWKAWYSAQKDATETTAEEYATRFALEWGAAGRATPSPENDARQDELTALMVESERC